MIISIDKEKAFDKTQYSSARKKNLRKLRIERDFFNLIKDILREKKFTSHFTVKDKCLALLQEWN